MSCRWGHAERGRAARPGGAAPGVDCSGGAAERAAATEGGRLMRPAGQILALFYFSSTFYCVSRVHLQSRGVHSLASRRPVMTSSPPAATRTPGCSAIAVSPLGLSCFSSPNHRVPASLLLATFAQRLRFATECADDGGHACCRIHRPGRHGQGAEHNSSRLHSAAIAANAAAAAAPTAS